MLKATRIEFSCVTGFSLTYTAVFKVYLFIFERERERVCMSSGGAEREGGKHPKQAPHHQGRTQPGARTHELRDHDPSRNQE